MKTSAQFNPLWKILALMSMLILLSACGGGESHLGAAEEKIEFAEDDTVNQTIDHSRPYELVISGSRNSNIIIASNNQITQLIISGDTNTITVSTGTTIDSLTFTGSDNTVTKSPGSVITTVIDETGGSNNVI